MLHHLFVYGTLKTGQCRESNWPLPPVEIRKAWTLGRLYDTGPYPTLIHAESFDSLTAEDNDKVAGQVWSFEAQDLPATFKVLDMIEGTNQPGRENNYDRKLVEVYLECGEQLKASVYLFARLDLLSGFAYLAPEVEADDQHLSIWPRGASWET
jgi:gamma-glutamylcyclotransferase (GGCT)/AIG2-like uncharacterized protein YtfP